MTKTEQINVFLRDRGYDISKLKGANPQADIIYRALNENEALQALDLYYKLEIPVLGGDVFYLDQNIEIDWTRDNWYFQKEEGEDEFLKRSIDGSANFIKNYQNTSFKNCTFLFEVIFEKPQDF
jgi:hypothetical protein